jgi:hypothetical protein
MIRSVCMNCHSLEFSIDALADASLIETNFQGRPSQHIESIDMAIKREKEKRAEKERKAKQEKTQLLNQDSKDHNVGEKT